MALPEYPDDYVEFVLSSFSDDKHDPLIMPGEPLPLGSYRVRHGEGIIGYSVGSARFAWNALLPDGRRVKAMRGWARKTWRRKAEAPPLLYQWGDLEIRDDDIVFTDGPLPHYVPCHTDDGPNMEFELARDTAFIEDLKDVRFAIAAQSIINHFDGWIRIDGQASVDFLGRDASAELIARLRGLGEDVMDFKFWDVPPGDPPADELLHKMVLHINRLGWRTRTSAEWHE